MARSPIELSRVSKIFHCHKAIVKLLSSCCKAVVIKLSSSSCRQAVVELSSNSCKAVVIKLSSSCRQAVTEGESAWAHLAQRQPDKCHKKKELYANHLSTFWPLDVITVVYSMISASLSLVSQALAQGVSTKQECSRGQEAPKGTGKRRQTAANVCPCTHKCTQVHSPIWFSGGIQTFRQDTHRHTNHCLDKNTQT